jgi:hypothetical protein
VVERVGVHDKPRDAPSEGTLDGTVEEPGPNAPADVGQRQSEELELVAAQLEEADQRAVVARNLQLVAGLIEQRLQGVIAQQPSLVP